MGKCDSLVNQVRDEDRPNTDGEVCSERREDIRQERADPIDHIDRLDREQHRRYARRQTPKGQQVRRSNPRCEDGDDYACAHSDDRGWEHVDGVD